MSHCHAIAEIVDIHCSISHTQAVNLAMVHQFEDPKIHRSKIVDYLRLFRPTALFDPVT
jgi:hypothetical protein